MFRSISTQGNGTAQPSHKQSCLEMIEAPGRCQRFSRMFECVWQGACRVAPCGKRTGEGGSEGLWM